jgi:hypothetical protein
MGALFLDMGVVVMYMDDIIVFGYAGFDEHSVDVAEVLHRLEEAGFQVNPDKCVWFAPSVNYLGFTITQEGIKPQTTKVQGILNMSPPRNQRDVCRFVGMVNFYRDLYPRRAETLSPLTDLCSKNKKFIWMSVHNDAFNNMKQIMFNDAMLTYPKFDQPFIIYSDSSDNQIGGIMTQDGKPLGFFSKKLNETQKRYPVTEQELLGITETLKYFRYMLSGHRIIVKTDHQNLTHLSTIHSSNRVLRQRLLLEEYGVELQHIPGESNVVAEALSRLPTAEKPAMSNLVALLSHLPTEELFSFDGDDDFPLNLKTMADAQTTDSHLQAALRTDTPKYVLAMRDGVLLYVYHNNNGIYVPEALRSPILQWYHTTLQHPGIKRMQATVKENILAGP